MEESCQPQQNGYSRESEEEDSKSGWSERGDALGSFHFGQSEGGGDSASDGGEMKHSGIDGADALIAKGIYLALATCDDQMSKVSGRGEREC